MTTTKLELGDYVEYRDYLFEVMMDKEGKGRLELEHTKDWYYGERIPMNEVDQSQCMVVRDHKNWKWSPKQKMHGFGWSINPRYQYIPA
jgi:hypothetical protein